MTVQQWLCYGCLACLKSTLTALWLCLIWWLLKNSTTYPATSSGWQIRSWQRWTRPILWAHLFMWHFTKAIWLTRPFEQLHLLLLFRNIAGFIPTHKVIRLLKFSIRFDLIILENMAATSCCQFSCHSGMGACLYESCLEWQDLLSSSTSFFSSEISRVSYLLIRLLGC